MKLRGPPKVLLFFAILAIFGCSGGSSSDNQETGCKTSKDCKSGYFCNTFNECVRESYDVDVGSANNNFDVATYYEDTFLLPKDTASLSLDEFSSCSNKCTKDGQRVCDGNDWKQCGDYNNDNCLEWSELYNCLNNEYCGNGICHTKEIPDTQNYPDTYTYPDTYVYPDIYVFPDTTCADECDYEGLTECISSNKIQECIPQLDGCLEWSETFCDMGYQCLEGNCVPCTNACDYAGQQICADTDKVGVCSWNQLGCLNWVSFYYCETGVKCENNKCVSNCVNECDYAGQESCNGNILVFCTDYDSDDCLEWDNLGDCGPDYKCKDGECIELGDYCDVCNSSADCKPGWECSMWPTFASWCYPNTPCSKDSDCGSELYHCKVNTYTDGTKTFQCAPQEHPICYGNEVWSEDFCGNLAGILDSCGNNQVCENGECVTSCVDKCSPLGKKECSGKGWKQCSKFDTSACLEWSVITSCKTNETCSDGVCVASCEDDPFCSSAGQKCMADSFGSFIVNCGYLDSDPCLELESAVNCSKDEKCQGNECVKICTDDCSLSGKKECVGNSWKQCGNYDADSCLEWSSVTPCNASETCSSGSCAVTCTDECTPSGKKECSGNSWKQCGNYDADSCLEWSSATQCNLDQVCTDGNCCTDLCDLYGGHVLGDTWCGGAGEASDLYKTCEKNSKGCPSIKTYWCSYGSICQDGKCVIICTDDCIPSDKKECFGNGWKKCKNYDTDECLEWSTLHSCMASETCFDGECVSSQLCGNGSCDSGESYCNCSSDCSIKCGDGCCSSGETYQNCPTDCPCVSNCSGKTCGDDGCGGSCGTCPSSYKCENYKCISDVKCGNGVCDSGENPCNCKTDCSGCCTISDCSSCGTCKEKTCTNYICGCKATTPCCGNSSCESGETCSACSQDCGSCATCGDGGCNGSDTQSNCCKDCGCPSGKTCQNNQCVCTPNCTNKECGDDGCGESCGSCDNPLTDKCLDSYTLRDYTGSGSCSGGQCNYSYNDSTCQNGCENGKCKGCTPKTCPQLIKECGSWDDGCGEKVNCPTCPSGKSCDSNGKCVSSCIDDCSPSGKKECSGNGWKQCGNYDADTCLEWSTLTSCKASETCSGGSCVPSCTDDCTPSGKKECSGNGWKQCGNYDADTCLEWSSVTPCNASETCSSGSCVATCIDECSYVGEKSCWGGDVVLTCGNYDADTCLDWSLTSCKATEICYLGACIAACTDDCTPSGKKECSGNSWKICNDYDTDSCLEWSSLFSCKATEVCSGGSCVPNCTDDCTPSGKKECVGNSWKQCGNYDADTCLEWSSLTLCNDNNDCTTNDTCQNGTCKGTPIVPNAQMDQYEGTFTNDKSQNATTLNSTTDCMNGAGIKANIYPKSNNDIDWYLIYVDDAEGCTLYPEFTLYNIPSSDDYNMCVYYEPNSDCTPGKVTCLSGNWTKDYIDQYVAPGVLGKALLEGCCSKNSGSLDEYVKLDPEAKGCLWDDDGSYYIKIYPQKSSYCGESYSLDYEF